MDELGCTCFEKQTYHLVHAYAIVYVLSFTHPSTVTVYRQMYSATKGKVKGIEKLMVPKIYKIYKINKINNLR